MEVLSLNVGQGTGYPDEWLSWFATLKMEFPRNVSELPTPPLPDYTA
jgi:hypothetical protein